MELFVVALVAAAAFAAYSMWRTRRAVERRPQPLPAPPAAALPSAERTLHDLVVGDIVSHLGTDYLVAGLLSLADDGRVTRLYRLLDGAAERWLVGRPGDDHGWLCRYAPEAEVPANGPELLTALGSTYRLAARAAGSATASGEVGAGREGGRVKVYEYRGAAQARLFAVALAERVDAFVGEELPAASLEFLPGDGRGA